MIDENIIIHEAEEYVSNNKTMKETANDLHISKRTLQLHFKRLKDIDEKLYQEVINKQEKNQAEGRVKGGHLGKATSKFTSDDAERMAKIMVDKCLSYKDAEEEFGIPKSTIYEILHSDLVSKRTKDMLDILAEANIHDLTTEELLRRKRK